MRSARSHMILVAMLAAAAGATGEGSVPEPALLQGKTAEQLMALANDWGMATEETHVKAWTTSRQIHFIFAGGARRDIALPDDLMVVSIAPYVMKTHPCKDHTPSSCRGEQADTPVHVKAATADGRLLLDEKTRTLPNGFVDLWLPRGEQIDVTVDALGLTATQRIGTTDQDQTCITTLKLHY